jgi:ATP-dependent RNA helicase DeaD
MAKFRQRSLQILVATDVAARGIDVDDITHVLHLNIPDEIEFYTHRSGRTARAGKKGVSIALINKRELGKVKQIERILKTTFKKTLIPSGEEVCQKQILALMAKVRDVNVNEEEIAAFLPAVEAQLADLSKEDLIKRFASIEFNRFLDYYRNAPDLNVEGRRTSEGGGSEERYVTGNRFFINLGKMDGLEVGSLIALLDEHANVGKKDLGKIDLKGAYSFFEVDKSRADDILKNITGIEYNGRQVRVEVTERRESSGGSRSNRTGRSESRRSGGEGGYRGGNGGGYRGGNGGGNRGGNGGSYGQKSSRNADTKRKWR